MLLHPAAIEQFRARAVGILCRGLGDPYSAALLRGAAQTLNRAGFHAVTLCGGFPRAPFYRDEAGQIAIPTILGSVIVLASNMRSLDAELGELLHTPGRVVSVGGELRGIPNIAANDEAGVFQVVAHLVKHHACRRVAFIAGPEESVDAIRRFDAYRLALEQFGLEYDPTLVARGNYEAHSGREAAQRFCQYGARHFDSLIAGNDLMAIGAMEGLRAAGISIPDTIKVFGFDDLEEAAFVTPGLSTVRQPMAEQGSAAAELAIRLHAGEGVDATRTLIPAPLVVRRSCGCGESEPSPGARHQGLDVEARGFVEEALRGVIRTRLAAQRASRELAQMAEAVLDAQDHPQLALALSPIVRLLDIEQLRLCTYSSDLRTARLTLESTRSGVIFHERPESFAATQLLPSSMLTDRRPTQFCVEPLELANEQLGYLVLEGELAGGTAPIELRQVLCAALGRIATTRELRRLYAADRKRLASRLEPLNPPSGPPPSASESVVDGAGQQKLSR